MNPKYSNKKLNKWPYHNVEMNNDNEEEFIAKTQQFIDFLENDYKMFINIKDKKIKDNGDFLKLINKNNNGNLSYKFDFEFSFKKSPLTIFDAPWGIGKTYFFESLIKYFLKKQIKLNIFENIIIIDAWKYSYISDIPEGIISEILERLSNKNDKLKEQLFNFATKIYNVAAIPWLRYFGFNVKEYEKKSFSKKLDNKIDKEIILPKTIIIIDNIERLGQYSWEILKAIFHLSSLENLIFILPMNRNKLFDIHNSNDEKDFEFPIEKFIDIEYYKFNQNYLGILKEVLFNESEDILNILNEMLNKEIDGEKLSIREAEKNILSIKSEFILLENNYSKFKYFANNVWMDFETIKSKIKLDISNFVSIVNEYDVEFNNFKLIEETKNYHEMLDLLQNFHLFDDELEISNDINYFLDNFNEIKDFDNLKTKFVSFKNNFKNLIENNNKFFESLENEIKNLNEDVKLKTDKIYELRKQENEESEENIEQLDNKSLAQYKIDNLKNNISNVNNIIDKKREEWENLDNKMRRHDFIIKFWELKLPELISIHEQYQNKINLLLNEHPRFKVISNIFNKKNANYKKLILSQNDDYINGFIDDILDNV